MAVEPTADIETNPEIQSAKGNYSLTVHATGTESEAELILWDPLGNPVERFQAVSGPSGKGALPGLYDGDHTDSSHTNALYQLNYNDLHIQVNFDQVAGTTLSSSAEGVDGTGSGIRLNPVIINGETQSANGRDGFWIHTDGGSRGTIGCVGLSDADSDKLMKLLQELNEKGVAPTHLAVLSEIPNGLPEINYPDYVEPPPATSRAAPQISEADKALMSSLVAIMTAIKEDDPDTAKEAFGRVYEAWADGDKAPDEIIADLDKLIPGDAEANAANQITDLLKNWVQQAADADDPQQKFAEIAYQNRQKLMELSQDETVMAALTQLQEQRQRDAEAVNRGNMLSGMDGVSMLLFIMAIAALASGDSDMAKDMMAKLMKKFGGDGGDSPTQTATARPPRPTVGDGVEDTALSSKDFADLSKIDTGDANFDRAVRFVLEREGGYVDHPADRGGKTIYGISERSHPDAWADGPPTLQEAVAIYKEEYWNKIAGIEDMSQASALIVFDLAVNSGAGRAQEMITEVGTDDPAKMLQWRQDFYDAIVENRPSQAVFANGWNNRLQHLADEIRQMGGTEIVITRDETPTNEDVPTKEPNSLSDTFDGRADPKAPGADQVVEVPHNHMPGTEIIPKNPAEDRITEAAREARQEFDMARTPPTGEPTPDVKPEPLAPSGSFV